MIIIIKCAETGLYLRQNNITLTMNKRKEKQRRRIIRISIVSLHVIIVLLLIHHFIFRPMFLDWGAPEQINRRAFSGDSLTNGVHHTRAVLIDATPEELWPWLNQIGQDRGGFYSYQWLENLFAADMSNVYTIKPEFQWPRQLGDTIWLANKDHYNGQGYQIIAEISDFKSIVMVGGADYARILRGEKASGSWAFYLYPEKGTGKTWLVARSSEGDMPIMKRLIRYFTYEVPHFIMEKKMLKSMKKLVESKPAHPTEVSTMR
jgi:hypothetical protein